MNETGKQMLLALNQIRGLFEEISRLLSTADSLMAETGWKSLRGSQATSDLSYALHTPRQWMPTYLCRFYQHPDFPSIISCVSVLIGVFDSYPIPLAEPLVSGLVFDYGKGNVAPKDCPMDYCNWHPYLKNRKDDGSISVVDPRVEWPADNCPAHKLISFALPILEISDSSMLRAKVIDRLLAEVGKA